MASQPGEQTIAITILPNIARSKANEATKFGQLIEHNNIKDIFVEKSYTQNVLEKLFADPYLKYQN